MISINLDLMGTLILAIVLYLFGNFLKNNIKTFTKFCIPSPVIGGLLFCILTLILRLTNICTITMDTRMMPYFLSFFFTIIGLGVSTSLIKKGGRLLFLYWGLCGVITFFQNGLSVLISKFVNIDPLLSIMCGTVSMVGGHGYSAAFGATLESLGINGATSVGIASATFGLILGGLIGGPVAKYLIEKYNLKPDNAFRRNLGGNLKKPLNSISSSYSSLTTSRLFEHILVILVCMTLGNFIANMILKLTNILIPTIVGCMLCAVIFRNSNDKFKLLPLDFKLLDFLSELSLGMFLTIALMSIDLYKLSSLFGPIIIIVVSQVLFMVLFGAFVCFRVLGKNYDAAVIVSGMLGHCLGATPNALVNMTSVTEKYGYSQKAFLVVPLVGAFLLDVFTMPSILLFINILS